MDDRSKGIYAVRRGSATFIRVRGRGTFQNGRALQQHAATMVSEGCRDFVMDLEHCTGLDSTFVGVLAGLAFRLRQAGNPGVIHMVRLSPANRAVLQTLGLERLFVFGPPGNGGPDAADFQKLPDSDPGERGAPLDREQTRALMLTAHDDLSRADQRNELRFADLTRLLRAEREKSENAGRQQN